MYTCAWEPGCQRTPSMDACVRRMHPPLEVGSHILFCFTLPSRDIRPCPLPLLPPLPPLLLLLASIARSSSRAGGRRMESSSHAGGGGSRTVYARRKCDRRLLLLLLLLAQTRILSSASQVSPLLISVCLCLSLLWNPESGDRVQLFSSPLIPSSHTLSPESSSFSLSPSLSASFAGSR